MLHGRTTLSKFIIEEHRRHPAQDEALSALVNDIQTACKYIGVRVARGALGSANPAHLMGAAQPKLSVASNEIMLGCCEWGGQLAGMASKTMDAPCEIPALYPRGPYLLVFNPLDGSSNIDVNVTVGTIFSVMKAPNGAAPPRIEDFLQPGSAQICAGYALYGPADMIVLTLGRGTHGFTLDPEIGAYILTHPDLRIAEDGREFAIDAANERFWEPPVQRYVDECVNGCAGPRGKDFNMRWVASLVAEVHRILMRGGLFMYPRDCKASSKPGRMRLLHEANPVSMIVEQAGGLASTGRDRILDILPRELHQRVPVILGSRHEVERLERYHREYDCGADRQYESPLFNVRSLFRNAVL